MSGFFSVKNFERFQHYKDRSPPWIRLYNSLLDDYDFGRLPDASKAHLLAIWLLASRYDNKVPFDPEWVARRINATDKVDLASLAVFGFIVPDQACSIMLADCKQDAMPEERRGEAETEKNTRPSDESPPIDGSLLALDAFNEVASEAGWAKADKLTPPRRTGLRRVLAEHGIDGWRAILQRARGSQFLCGANDRGWCCDLDFLLTPRKLTKLLEGSYDGSATNGRPGPDKPHDTIFRSLAKIAARGPGHGERPPDPDGGLPGDGFPESPDRIGNRPPAIAPLAIVR